MPFQSLGGMDRGQHQFFLIIISGGGIDLGIFRWLQSQISEKSFQFLITFRNPCQRFQIMGAFVVIILIFLQNRQVIIQRPFGLFGRGKLMCRTFSDQKSQTGEFTRDFTV